MGRPYRFSAAHTRGQPSPNVAIVDLSGQWRANVADDERRRSAVGLDYFDDDWPEVEVPSHWRNLAPFADNDEPLIYRKRFELDPAACRAPAFRDARRHLLSGRCLARRRLPGRSGGVLLPPQLRHHQPVAPGHRARARRRSGLPTAAQPKSKRTITGVFQNWNAMDPDVESRWHLARGAHRHDRSGADRQMACPVSRRQRHPCPPAPPRPPRQRRGADGTGPHPRRRRSCSTSTNSHSREGSTRSIGPSTSTIRGCGGRGPSETRS